MIKRENVVNDKERECKKEGEQSAPAHNLIASTCEDSKHVTVTYFPRWLYSAVGVIRN
jgi:hypothetical protein